MKTIVVYSSKTGFVKRYAQWIAEALSADLVERKKAAPGMLASYDTIIYGGSLYATGILGVKLITRNLDKLKGKKIVVFATGASPAKEEAINDVTHKNFTPEQMQKIRFFYLRGGFDFNKLPPFEKMLMSLMKWTLKRKRDLTPDEKGMLKAFEKPADFTDKKNIDELLAYVRS